MGDIERFSSEVDSGQPLERSETKYVHFPISQTFINPVPTTLTVFHSLLKGFEHPNIPEESKLLKEIAGEVVLHEHRARQAGESASHLAEVVEKVLTICSEAETKSAVVEVC
ncbi:hypothetical protein AVEN_268772-1 [Araneus ventricosus]|uniref:Uncharacterized protein n=1 Tax=Araneus ventricosus TaxID=182803 RepID=A0A4Y2K7M3_ARAVE|nr:hypothetical protein AVEN_268772-1 [Araneus ventricosus]